MGSRGPAPIPTNILKLRGSWRAGINPDEPKTAICIPVMPAHIKGVAKEEWDRVAPMLLKAGCISEVDLALFESYCVAYALKVDSIKRPKKYTISEKLKITNSLKTLAAEFGLSPSSRTRIKTEPKQAEADPFDALSKRTTG